MTQPVFRFAPSPNGRLHRGHAFSALLNEALARRLGGRLLLRIEDIDTARSRPAFVAGIEEDLAWLGLTFEEPRRRQSEHLAAYGERLADLKARGLLYPCFCSRRSIAGTIAKIEAARGSTARDPEGAPLYPGTCRGLSPRDRDRRIARGEPHAWRLSMQAALAGLERPLAIRVWDPDTGGVVERPADPARWGDVVLARKDTPGSYHLCVVHDDAEQGVTHVVRGRDLEAATDLHVLLQALFALPGPLYHHHALVPDADGRKLSKSLGSLSLAEERAAGADPRSIRGELGFPASPDPEYREPEDDGAGGEEGRDRDRTGGQRDP